MSIRFEKPGMLTTVQDLGRTGSARYGINRNGAMDPAAARVINLLLANEENAATLEMHFPAPHIVFEADTIFALGGADFGAELNSEPIGNWRAISARKDSELRFVRKTLNNRAYIAVKGGLAVNTWLGSVSTNQTAGVGGLNGRKIEAGDRIEFPALITEPASRPIVSNSLIPGYSRFPTVRIITGAEFDLLSDAAKALLVEHDFTITGRSDRMGFRLAGAPIIFDPACELISSAVTFGTIQLLPDGQLIVLMADHQTSGGYPRVGHVITRDLPLIGQLGPNDKIAFHLVSIGKAEALAAEYERELNLFKVGCRLLWNAAS